MTKPERWKGGVDATTAGCLSRLRGLSAGVVMVNGGGRWMSRSLADRWRRAADSLQALPLPIRSWELGAANRLGTPAQTKQSPLSPPTNLLSLSLFCFVFREPPLLCSITTMQNPLPNEGHRSGDLQGYLNAQKTET